jgi:DHA2 family multidrug resistance protein
MLTRNMTVMHADLTAFINPFRPAIAAFHGSPFDPAHPLGATVINGLISQQAAIVAYADDFWLMFWVTLAIVPLVMLMKRPASSRQGRGGGMAHAAME